MGQQVACCASSREKVIELNKVGDQRFANFSREVGIAHMLAFAPLWPQKGAQEKRVAVASTCNVTVFEVIGQDGLTGVEFREEHQFSTCGVTSIAFPNETTSDFLCLGYADGHLRVYSCVKNFVLVQKITEHVHSMVVIRASRDHLILGDSGGFVSVTSKPDATTNEWMFLQKEPMHTDGIVSLAVDRLFAYSISTDLNIFIWTHPALTMVGKIDCHEIVTPICSDPLKLTRLLIVERPLSRWGLQGSVRGAHKVPGGMLFVAAELEDTQGVLMELNLARNEWLSASITPDKGIDNMIFGPYDNGPLVTATVDGALDIWKWTSGEMLSKTLGEVIHDGPTALALEPQHRLYSLGGGILTAWWWRELDV